MKQNDCQLVTIAAQSEHKCRDIKCINQINDTIKVAYRLMVRVVEPQPYIHTYQIQKVAPWSPIVVPQPNSHTYHRLMVRIFSRS